MGHLFPPQVIISHTRIKLFHPFMCFDQLGIEIEECQSFEIDGTRESNIALTKFKHTFEGELE